MLSWCLLAPLNGRGVWRRDVHTLHLYGHPANSHSQQQKQRKKSCLLIRHKIYGASVSHKPLLSPPPFFSSFLLLFSTGQWPKWLNLPYYVFSLFLLFSLWLCLSVCLCFSVCVCLSLLPPCFFVSVRQLKLWGSPSVGLEGSVCNLFPTPVDTFTHYLKRYLLIGLLGFQ